MGTPAFFWYPVGGSPTASLEVTDLGEELSDLQVDPIRHRVDERSLGGRLGTTLTSGGRQSVHIVLERFVDEDLAKALESLSAYLERAGGIGFTRDQGKTWAGYAYSSPGRGDTEINVPGHVWHGAAGTLVDGDWLCIEGLGMEGHREYVRFSARIGSRLELQTPLVYDYNDDVVMVRWHHYWPSLSWTAEQMQRSRLVKSVRGIYWTLDVTLETDPAVAALLASEESSPLLGIDPGYNGLTIDDLLIRATRPTPAASAVARAPRQITRPWSP